MKYAPQNIYIYTQYIYAHNMKYAPPTLNWSFPIICDFQQVNMPLWQIMYHSTVSLEICGFDRSVSWITAFASPWFIALMDHHWCLLGVQTTMAERLASPSQILQLNMNSSHHDHQDVHNRLHLEFWNWGLRTFCTFRHYCSAFAGDWQGGNLIGWLFFLQQKENV